MLPFVVSLAAAAAVCSSVLVLSFLGRCFISFEIKHDAASCGTAVVDIDVCRPQCVIDDERRALGIADIVDRKLVQQRVVAVAE